MAERRTARIPQKVVHRHRIGALVYRRVSEFLLLRGEPKAILRWIDIAGVRTPIYLALDPQKLRRIRAGTQVLMHYDGVTVDPAHEYAKPPRRAQRRGPGAPMPGGRRRTDPPVEGNPT